MRINPEEMRRLRRILETAEFDHGHDDPTETDTIADADDNTETTKRGTADVYTRYTSARSGDNPLRDLLDERDQTGDVDRVEEMLRAAGVGDEEMRAGVDLSPVGLQKVAARLGIQADQVPLLLGSLATKLNQEAERSDSAYESAYHAIMNERLGYEKDGVGSVTVRDSQTGQEIYLQGSQATDLLIRLRQSPDNEQAILAHALSQGNPGDTGPLTEAIDDLRDDGPSASEIGLRKKIMANARQSRDLEPDRRAPPVDEATDSQYLSEMRQDRGSFNFAWKDGSAQGTGTAGYDFSDGAVKLKLMGVRDASGEPIRPDPALRQRLERIAHDTIQDEAV